MSLKNTVYYLSIVSVTFLVLACAPKAGENELVLREGWKIQSSALSFAAGPEISTLDYLPEDWYGAKVPSTVFAALRQNGLYKNVFLGKNLQHVLTAPFDTSWWYRKVFTVTEEESSQIARLFIPGVYPKANIWLNGLPIASADTGRYTTDSFVLNVTGKLHEGANVLAVEVLPPQGGDAAFEARGKYPRPPDGNMGLWRPVYLRFTNAVSLDHPFVRTKLDLRTLEEADITITVEVTNHSSREVRGKLVGILEFDTFGEYIKLLPGETKTVTLSSEKYPNLHLKYPRIWWPETMGQPELYNLKLRFLLNGRASDERSLNFAVREIKTVKTGENRKEIRVNGKTVMLRGGYWRPDLFVTQPTRKLEAQIRYIRHMNLNLMYVTDYAAPYPELARLCDRYGIVLVTSGDDKNRKQTGLAQAVLHITQDSISAYATIVNPGVILPPMESLEKILPPENLWPFDDVWAYHCSSNNLSALTTYKQRLDAQYGPSQNLEDFCRKAQLMNYETIRTTLNHFSLNNPETKGIILNILNAAWPLVDGAFYDYDLLPTAAYYALRETGQPIRLIYDSKNEAIYISNTSLQSETGLIARIRLFDFQSEEILSEEINVDAEAQSTQKIYTLPPVQNNVTFLSLTLFDNEKAVARSFYWRPPQEKSHAFLTLRKLPLANVKLSSVFDSSGDERIVRVTLRNDSNRLAFFIRLKLVDEKAQNILPVQWEDNYITLLPQETRTIRAQFTLMAGHDQPEVIMEGWNLPPAAETE